MSPMQDSASYSRKQLYIKPGFQRKMMIIMILLVTIAANLVGGLCYGLISWTLEDELLMQNVSASVDPSQIPILKQNIFSYIYPKVLIAEALTILVLFFLTLRLTHHIAGPVFRLERNMQEMTKGNLELKTFFRNKDEFAELATALNELRDSYLERIDSIRTKLDVLKKTDLSPEQRKMLAELEPKLQTTLPKEPGFDEDFQPADKHA